MKKMPANQVSTRTSAGTWVTEKLVNKQSKNTTNRRQKSLFCVKITESNGGAAVLPWFL
jgi:hypothetical protein